MNAIQIIHNLIKENEQQLEQPLSRIQKQRAHQAIVALETVKPLLLDAGYPLPYDAELEREKAMQAMFAWERARTSAG